MGLTQSVHLNPLSVLFWSGVVHIVAGCVFKIPLPYQPMKAMGVFAIAHGVSQGEYLLAGFILGILIVVLNTFQWFQKLYDVFPICVVRGIQVGLGISLFKTAIDYILSVSSWGPFLSLVPHVSFSLSFLEFPVQTWTWTSAVFTMIVIQFPLTVANSIFSPALLVQDYFPNQKIPPSKIAWSVGIMNVLLCPFGAMPACHGAGGLAAQYRFGARSGWSIIFLGGLKIIGALCLGSFFLDVATHFPKMLMGIFFLFPAVDLCLRIQQMKNFLNISITVMTAVLYICWSPIAACALGWGFYELGNRFKMRLKEA